MAHDTKEIDIEKEELTEQGGYRSIRIKTVRGDGVRDMDEVTAEFVSNDFEEFNPEREEVEE